MPAPPINRRRFLLNSAVLGCSAAASPLLTPISFMSAPWDNRLVVIILRGAMDGLGVVQPYGDPDYAALGREAPNPAMDLDGFFAMNTALQPLMPMWRNGELGFVHAVSTPYRDKRSHFDGQDLLEAGSARIGDKTSDGWLNRLLQQFPDLSTETAYAIGRQEMIVLNGAAPVTRWTPESDLTMSPQAMKLAQLVMQDDPAFDQALRQAFALAETDGDSIAFEGTLREIGKEMRNDMTAAMKKGAGTRIAQFAAERLAKEARIASFSINGWDTHDNQTRELAGALGQLSDALIALKEGLGPAWSKTTVLAMTEFGRTARMNGTGGTDHGTAGAMLFAGGAVRGGRVLTNWPGLEESALYARRDLLPTRDVRAYAGWAMRGLFGVQSSTLERVIFPGLDLEGDPGLLL